MLLTGKKFKEKYKNEIFVKLTNETENHNGFQFHTGLNIDTNKFDSVKSYGLGLFFCEISKLSVWLSYISNNSMYYIRYVTLPDDSQVFDCVGSDSFKADKFILSERKLISELDEWNDDDYCLKSFKQNKCTLQYIKNVTYDMYLVAVGVHGSLIKFVKNQTSEICVAALRRDGLALQYIILQTPELCKIAVGQNGLALQYIILQTPELCKIAVGQNGLALQYVTSQTSELCRIAVKQNGLALQYVITKTDELCKIAIWMNPLSAQYINNPTIEICFELLQNLPRRSKTIDLFKLIDNICLQKLHTCWSDVLFLRLIRHNKSILVDTLIGKLNFNQKGDILERIYLSEIKQDGLLLKYVKNQTNEICLEAVRQNVHALKHVKQEFMKYVIDQLGLVKGVSDV
jgi:hypothetical protein